MMVRTLYSRASAVITFISSRRSATAQGTLYIRNHPPNKSAFPVTEIVSPDALALVRFGLRDAHDPRIVNTIKVIDALTQVNTSYGPAWHRYNHDGYGEHADGSPYDGVGIGRAWPLLTGERAHYGNATRENVTHTSAHARSSALESG